jgi:MerR family transcriptional regulator, repressor of the yfmOP operon
MSHLDTPAPDQPATRLLRIQEVAAALGLTARTIRYYEELGLLTPAARSEGDYRLYDADDVERLRFIKDLRDDAGFSLAEISQLLEDEAARTRFRARFTETTDATERRTILEDSISRIDRQIASLRVKLDRLQSMIDDAESRRTHLSEHLDEIHATGDTTPHGRTSAGSPAGAPRPAAK